jgi:hypothetical protein
VRNGRSGFTLFETMLGIVILLVLAGGVFGTVGSVISAVEVLQVENERQMNREALAELLRKNFAALPPKAVLRVDVREEGGGYYSELVLEKAPGAFSWGRDFRYFGLTVLGLEKAADGLLDLKVIRMEADEGLRLRKIPDSLLLVGGLREFRWECFDGLDRQWTGKWDNRARRPSLVRLVFQFQGESESAQITFAMPWTQARSVSKDPEENAQ